jgi:peroxin-2
MKRRLLKRVDHALDESAEWARASEARSTDEDSHSEEYDEDEQEEGEELDYGQ